MSLRLAAPTLRSTARLMVARQQPMGLVKIHSCKTRPLLLLLLETTHMR